MTAGPAEVVISTKLFRPDPRHQTVERTRLHDLLRQGCSLPLTLVVAPAGWGKSTLVADWLRQDRVAAGWVSLDGGDDDPKRFWRYLLLAAGQAVPAAGAAALRRLDAAGSDVLRDVLPTFVNEMTSSDAPLVLVLDDYHLVTSTQVHALVTTLLDPNQFPAQRRGFFGFSSLDWPYVEGLRLDEAMHPLTLVTVGMYGQALPNQNTNNSSGSMDLKTDAFKPEDFEVEIDIPATPSLANVPRSRPVQIWPSTASVCR